MRRTLPRRILMTADCVGGVWNYALELVAGLGADGVEVTLFVSGGVLSPDQMREAGRLDNLTIVRSELKLEWMDASAADIAETNALLRELEAEIAPDIVHVNGYANAAAGFEAPVVVVAHSCVDTWWRACRDGRPGPGWSAYREGMRAGLANAACLVSPTRAHLTAFAAAHGPPPAARVIHNGTDADRFAPAPKSPHALACGRFWDEAKNLAVLRDVARRGVPIRVAGETGHEEAAEPARIEYLGRLGAAAMARQMAEASVFVAPSLYEPFGLAVLEAALSGCALVLSDIATFRELWDGVAIFADPRDGDAIAAAIAPLIADPARARARGEAARRHARRYSARAMSEGYLALYAGLLDAARTGAAA